MKHKLLLAAFLFFSITSVLAQKAPASADEIMKEAFAVAKTTNKKVLIMFHASWCGWCHKMDTS
jgi:thioredoxin-related protein